MWNFMMPQFLSSLKLSRHFTMIDFMNLKSSSFMVYNQTNPNWLLLQEQTYDVDHSQIVLWGVQGWVVLVRKSRLDYPWTLFHAFISRFRQYTRYIHCWIHYEWVSERGVEIGSKRGTKSKTMSDYMNLVHECFYCKCSFQIVFDEKYLFTNSCQRRQEWCIRYLILGRIGEKTDDLVQYMFNRTNFCIRI